MITNRHQLPPPIRVPDPGLRVRKINGISVLSRTVVCYTTIPQVIRRPNSLGVHAKLASTSSKILKRLRGTLGQGKKRARRWLDTVSWRLLTRIEPSVDGRKPAQKFQGRVLMNAQKCLLSRVEH